MAVLRVGKAAAVMLDVGCWMDAAFVALKETKSLQFGVIFGEPLR